MMRFLKTFDLNSVQIGIDLSTESLIMTDDFRDFIKHRYVYFLTHNIKQSSIFRYLNKMEYYENCIFNPEQEFNKLFLMFSSNSLPKFNNPFILSRLDDSSEASKKIIQENFNINNADFNIVQQRLDYKNAKSAYNHIKYKTNNFKTNKDNIKIALTERLIRVLNYEQVIKIIPYAFDFNEKGFIKNKKAMINFLAFIKIESNFLLLQKIFKQIPHINYINGL